LAGLVHALAREKKEFGDDAGGHTGTYSRSATIEMLDIFASRFEFQQRTWIIFGIFCVGLACYRLDPQVSGVVLAMTLRSHITVLQRLNPQTSARVIFLLGAFVVALGGFIRAWGAAYLRAEVVHDSRVRTEKLVADGPFRYSRNPLYLGLLIGVFGAGPLFSRTGWLVQMILAIVFCYRLIRREEAELYLVQGDSFVTYFQSVPRLLPALKARVATSGALPHWREGLAAQTPWWAIAAGEVAYAVTLRLNVALLVALAGVPVHVAQKRARASRLAATKAVR
jgi:protein-S-isoprenylcysteine O-methyltransferase Ste14